MQFSQELCASRILVLAIISCMTIDPLWSQQNDAEAQFFDDGVFRSVQTRQALKLLGENQLVSTKQLSSQLDRTTHQLALQPERKLAAEVDLVDLYRRCSQSVLCIAEVRDCYGCGEVHVTPVATAFAITADGILFTNRHVIEDIDPQSRLVVSRMDGTTCAVVEILASDKLNDTALLKANGDSFQPLPLSLKNPVGTQVAVVSHPSRSPYSLSFGIVTRLSKRVSVRSMDISAEFAKGSSGAPVLDYAGNVLGMVAMTTDVNNQMVLRTCIPSQSLLDLLGKSQPEPLGESPDPDFVERQCLRVTFNAMKQLAQEELTPDELNRRISELHAVMMHAIGMCPEDPIAEQYNKTLKGLRNSRPTVKRN